MLYRYAPYVSIFNREGGLIKTISLNIDHFKEKYRKNIIGAKSGPDGQRMVHIAPFSTAAAVENGIFYYKVVSEDSEFFIYCVKENGELDRIIPFKYTLPFLWGEMLKQKKGKYFITTNRGKAVVRLYLERPRKQ